MSSDIMSRPFDAKPFGLIYAGAQKNIGPSGTRHGYYQEGHAGKNAG